MARSAMLNASRVLLGLGLALGGCGSSVLPTPRSSPAPTETTRAEPIAEPTAPIAPPPPTTAAVAPPASTVATAPRGPTDVNGDGLYDLVIPTPYPGYPDADLGAGYLFYGAANGGFDTHPTRLAARARTGSGMVLVFLGSRHRGTTRASQTLADPVAHRDPGAGVVFGLCVGTGDLDADGFTDLAVGSSDDAVYVYLGGPHGVSARPSATLRPATGAHLDEQVRVAHVDDDSYADIVVGESHATIFHGGADGVATEPTESDAALPSAASALRIALDADPSLGVPRNGERPETWLHGAVLADVDGDGSADLVASITRDEEATSVGSVRVYRGLPSGFAPPSEQSLPSGRGVCCTGASMLVPVEVGDVDGDGRDDVRFVEDLADGADACVVERDTAD